jgi:hypothetical protein
VVRVFVRTIGAAPERQRAPRQIPGVEAFDVALSLAVIAGDRCERAAILVARDCGCFAVILVTI